MSLSTMKNLISYELLDPIIRPFVLIIFHIRDSTLEEH